MPQEWGSYERRSRHWDRVNVEITGIRRAAIEVRSKGQLHLRSLNAMERGLKLSEQRQVRVRAEKLGMLYMISFLFVRGSMDILY